jgi:outer membrane protein OmpA-like peptidoglycan-associated protein
MDDGDITGNNQLVRLRSSSGHQILLNDTIGVVYIANAEGSAWIEMTASGKIDIYAGDSVSIHSEGDFNFKADRNINLEAGQSICMKSAEDTVINSDANLHLLTNGDVRVRAEGDLEMLSIHALNLTSAKTMNFRSYEKLNLMSSGGDLSLIAVGGDVKAGPKVRLKVVGDQAATALKASGSTTKLNVTQVPVTSVSAGWPARYQNGTVDSIMARVPMHEPWAAHDSYNPSFNAAYVTGNPESGVPGTTPPVVMTYYTDAWFDFDKAVLLPAGQEALTAFADKIKQSSGPHTITIVGHTDGKGTASYNQDLSERRAKSAKTFLVSQGLESSSIITRGKGATEPVAANEINGKDNPEGRAKNRRVEIKVVGSFADVPTSTSDEGLSFTARTGDKAHFEQLSTAMKNAMRAMAKDYNLRTNKSIIISSSYRSSDEETDLYNRWLAAGGRPKGATGANDPGVPTAGGITTPVKPGSVSPHTKGIAVDSPTAAQLESLGLLAKYGLRRPYSWDPNHIQLGQ